MRLFYLFLGAFINLIVIACFLLLEAIEGQKYHVRGQSLNDHFAILIAAIIIWLGISIFKFYKDGAKVNRLILFHLASVLLFTFIYSVV